MKTKTIIIGLVLVLVVFGLGWYLHQPSQYIVGSSPVGTTQATAKVAYITFAPSIGNATSTSILNTDANDRVIKSSEEACTGIGTSYTGFTGTGLLSAGLIITASTSSVPTPVNGGTLANTNYVFDTSNTISTTTGFYFLSSSTPATVGLNATDRIWASGSYITFQANATNTMTCTIGVSYMPE